MPAGHRRVLLAVLSLLVIAGCGNSDPLRGSGGSGSTDPTVIVVGSANFPESETIADIYATALRANGFRVRTKMGIGSREAYIPAVRSGSIDVIPDYTGNLLQYLAPDSTATSENDVNAALAGMLGPTLTLGAPARAQDADAVVVTAATARRWRLTSIGDLAPHSKDVSLAATNEFAERPNGLPGLRRIYGLDIAPNRFVPIADGGGPATVDALTSGKVTAADIFTTSPAIQQNNLVVLTDPKHNFAAQNVVPVINAAKRSDKLIRVLDAVSAQLTTADLVELNRQVSGSAKVEPATAATRWAAAHGLDQAIGVS